MTITRRQFAVSTLPLLGAAVSLSACSNNSSPDDYSTLATAIRRPSALSALTDVAAINYELIRYATLAPSSHNTQCWKFALTSNVIGNANSKGIMILPDLSRRCPAVDPDDHHVFISLGCATENLVQAALAHGLYAQPSFDTTQDAINVSLTPTTARSSPLFQAIATRQCTRADYDGKPLSIEELQLLERAGTSGNVRIMLLTQHSDMERVKEYVLQGNSAQIADPAFVKELKMWMRFNGTEAARTRDGLFSATTGNPTIPTWLGELAFPWLFTAKSENDKIARQISSSAGIALFVGQAADKANWVDVGRAYERFALQATALGIRNAFLNQPVEVAAVRSPFAVAMGIPGLRPDLVVRFGRGPVMPQSLRRSVHAVLV